MDSNSKLEIYSSRELKAPIEIVYEAFSNPAHLSKWWGPNGFTNTFHEFDLRSGGKSVLTMHGPEKGNYENSSVFKIVEPFKVIKWQRISKPLFEMEVVFKKLSDSETEISFRMIFETEEECNKIKNFAGPKNEENFDRLEMEIQNVRISHIE